MFEVNKYYPRYDENLVKPMREEVVKFGFIELKNKKEVEDLFEKNYDKTILVFINSVCGCSAGTARPGLIKSLNNEKLPDVFATAFAGQDIEAVESIRKLTTSYPPSSPSIFIFKNKEVIFALNRIDIEGKSSEEISLKLKEAYNML
jgi:putative YphP/YqiW family bacilliredoxin